MVLIRAIVVQRNRKSIKKWLKKDESKFNIKQTDMTYLIDPDMAVFEERRPWFLLWKKTSVMVYFYNSDYPKPINPYTVEGSPKEEELAVSPGELRQVFNPIFYQIIARLQKNKKEDIMLFAIIGCVMLCLLILWEINKLKDLIGAI